VKTVYTATHKCSYYTSRNIQMNVKCYAALDINTLRTGEANLSFYITTAQDG